jgi:DNA-binding transcriptional ArsR family regulator
MKVDIDKVFKALAEPNRRRLLDLLHRENGQTLTARNIKGATLL